MYTVNEEFTKGGVEVLVNNQNIKAELARKNLTQLELANLLGVSGRTVSLKINGVRQFTAEELYKVSKILDVDINIFFNNVVNKKATVTICDQ